MLKIPVESIIQRIHEETGLATEKIEEQVKAKIESLDGLVSAEGAAFIVASELGVQLLREPAPNKSWKIKDLVVGLRSVDVSGFVDRIYRVIPYTYKGQAKEMASFVLRDDTGDIRVALWDDKVTLLKEGKLQGSVRIKGAQVKENKTGGKELHVGGKSVLLVTEGPANIPSAKESKISELKAGDSYRIMGEIVKIFPPKLFPVCSKCGKKVIPAPEGFLCSEHKQVTPENRLLMSIYVDDGTGVIRAIAFGKFAEKLCQATGMDVNACLTDLEFMQGKLLGRTVRVEGRVKNNEKFARTELIVSDIDTSPDAKGIATRMLGE